MEDPLRRQEEPQKLLEQLLVDIADDGKAVAADQKEKETSKTSRAERRRNAKLAKKTRQSEKQEVEKNYHH